MSYLLLPDDEREMVEHFRELGWQLLDGRVYRGRPVLLDHHSLVLSADLPTSGRRDGPLFSWLFWCAEWGAAVAVGDAPDPADVVRQTIRHVARTRRAIDDAVDPHRTPLVQYRRCHWQPGGTLAPGFLNGMDRPRRDWPRALLRAFGQAERWLKLGAVRINPFDYSDAEADRRVATAVTWVRPAAYRWLEAGGRISTVAF